MEIVDVGSRPADEVLDLLFEGQALKSLLRRHGAACFALVRPMAASQFFRELIENSDTLDATTKKHVAFVVFYGDRSRVVNRDDIGYGPYGGRPLGGPSRVRLNGLSISGDPEVLSDVMVRPTIPPRPGRGRVRRDPELFSKELGGRFRDFPETVNQTWLAHHMSRVATRLMELYDVRESALPCMLFTDGEDLQKHLVVRLDPDDPLNSLYTDVLRPLSDQFATLSKYWRRRADFSSKPNVARMAADEAVKLRAKITELDAEIERQKGIIPPQIRREQETIHDLMKARQERLAALPVETSERGKFVQKLVEELAAIARGERQFRSSAEQTLETARLEKRLFREQQRLAAYTGMDLSEETDRIRRLRDAIEQLQSHVPGLEQRRRQLEADLARENQRIEENSPENLKREEAAIQQMAKELQGVGYGPEILLAARPSAFAAIEVMFRNGLLGARRTTALEARPMRILFLAANPKTTTHVDLEEELRSLEVELRGVKYRDQVVLTARHAVRPDDLVRYVREEQPTIVHFSGHASREGIFLRDDKGGYTKVNGASLARFFKDRGVKLVVLNACCTQEQAKLLPGAVSAVVGSTGILGDIAARRFSVAFYRALGEGYSIRDAFRDGGDVVVLENRNDVFWADGELDQSLVAPAKS